MLFKGKGNLSHRIGIGTIARARRILLGIIAAAIILSLLSVCLFPSVSTNPVKTAGTIVIMPDGSVQPSDAPIQTSDNITYVLTADISDSIQIRRSNMVFDGAQHNMHGTGGFDGISLRETTNVTVKNVEIKGQNAK